MNVRKDEGKCATCLGPIIFAKTGRLRIYCTRCRDVRKNESRKTVDKRATQRESRRLRDAQRRADPALYALWQARWKADYAKRAVGITKGSCADCYVEITILPKGKNRSRCVECTRQHDARVSKAWCAKNAHRLADYATAHPRSAEHQREKSKRQRSRLCDSYVRDLIRQDTSIPIGAVPVELIEAKRLFILIQREIRKLNEKHS